MSLMVSISGIRGIVGGSLTPETVVKYVSAYAEYCNRGPIVIGRDGRITGLAIAQTTASALQAMGCDVISLGICPTPTVALAVEKLRAAGGISITASHNPMMWNGMKFFAPSGLFLDAEENKAFWDIADRPSRSYVAWDKQGKIEDRASFLEDHNKSVLSLPFLDIPALKRRRFKVALDCVNAAGCAIVPQLLNELGCEVIPFHCELTGIFGHTPEPIPENLTGLCDRVRETGADLGIAVDPDVDRLVLINERGEPFGEEYTITACVDFILRKLKPANPRVVVNLSTTRAVDDVVSAAGGEIHKTPVGEINVAKRMVELGAIIGGEGSGGVIFPQVHAGRDAIVGIALVMQSLLEFGGSLSALKERLPRYEITKGKVEVAGLNADAVFQRLRTTYGAEGRISTADGLKIDFASSWVHLRKSNTEPIVRIIAEAPRKSEADGLVRKFTDEILAK